MSKANKTSQAEKPVEDKSQDLIASEDIQVKVKVLKNCCSANYSFSTDDPVREIPENLAKSLIAAGYAKAVK